jgi:hypothetical protein
VAAVPGQTAAALLAGHGGQIAQIVRGEAAPLAPEERDEVLQNRLSYFPEDLFVAGWNAAFLCDTPDGAASSMPLIEYANSQLLEYRYYDALLTNVLDGVYQKLDRAGPQARWRLAREAARLNKVLIDVRGLSERTDTAIKFVSDMFSARLYRLAATRVGVPDFRRLVDNKLRTAGELYAFMVDDYNQKRAFLLELTIVIILIIDLILLLRGG